MTKLLGNQLEETRASLKIQIENNMKMDKQVETE